MDDEPAARRAAGGAAPGGTAPGGTASGRAAEGGADGEGQRALDALALSDEERLVLAKVGEILRRVNFGTVVLVVQDGKVVQIEMAEKFRLR